MKQYNMTLKQIIKVLETFATNHKQINMFYSGDDWDFQAQTNLYTAMVMIPSNATYQNGMLNVSIGIFFADLCNKDNSNVDDVLSDTLQIWGDLFSYLNDYSEDLITEFAYDIEPFVEAYDDITAGYAGVITFSTPFGSSICNLPL